VPNASPRLACLLVLGALTLGATACSSGTPTFPIYPEDSGWQCSPTGAIPTPGPADAGTADSGAADAATGDAGLADSGLADSGLADSGLADSGTSDGGPGDPPPAVDASAPLPGCPMGEVCLDHRCYPTCRNDDDCATSEQCDADGACVPRTRPRPDAGPVDSGPTDPCDGVVCMDPTPVCNSLTGVCQPCGLASTLTSCNPRTQVCEIARGRCSAFDPATLSDTCAPCNASADCAGGATCLTRDTPVERVCVPSCDLATPCPQGLTCNASGVCLPLVGSCFEWRGAADGRGCANLAECAPIGAALTNVGCQGLAGGTSGLCETICSTSADCPPNIDCFMGFCHKPTACTVPADCAGGLMCAADGFCHPLPTM